MARPTAALVETTRRSQLADAADYGDCVSHSSYFWGFRLHGLFALDGTRGPWLSPRPSSPNATPALPCTDRCPRTGPLERHGARTLPIALNYRLGRPPRALIDSTA